MIPNPMILNKDELAILTGYKRRGLQCEQLRAQGIPFRVNAHGEPVVCRSAIEGPSKVDPIKETWEPALSA